MISACVLVRCKAGKFRSVAERVKEIEGVVRVFTAAGRWMLWLKLRLQI